MADWADGKDGDGLDQRRLIDGPGSQEYGIIDEVIVTTRHDGQSAANDGRLGLAAAGGGKPKPRPEPEREGPKTSL